ncbi:MAG TPA: RNA-binding protein [Gallionella sp.]
MEKLLSKKYLQAQLQTLSAARTPDGEILVILQEYFSLIGTISSVHRFPSADKPDKRCFLINFADAADATRVSSRYKLRPFAFTGVLVELAQPASAHPATQALA